MSSSTRKPNCLKSELLAHRAVFDCSLQLAAVFAWLPPSSSDPTERKSVFPPSPPAHNPPLGLVLAALARLCSADRRREHRGSADLADARS